MNSKQQLAALKRLYKIKSFDSQEHCTAWGEEVLSNLIFNGSIRREFGSAFNVIGTPGLSGDAYATAATRMQAILAQAIPMLEGQIEDRSGAASTPAPKPTPLELPEKITLAWILRHVPLKFWGAAVGVLLAAFFAGVTVGESKFFADLTAKNRPDVASPNH